MSETLLIAPGAVIDPAELWFTFQRSSGPGGQNVNKVETRVTLHFDLAATTSLTDEQKQRIGRRLATRINRDGIMRVVASRHRTQSANRRAAVERFTELLADALQPAKTRRKTRVSTAAKQRRLEEKRRRSQLKRLRGSREADQ